MQLVHLKKVFYLSVLCVAIAMASSDKVAEDPAHQYSSGSLQPELIRACEEDNAEYLKQKLQVNSDGVPVVTQELKEVVPTSYLPPSPWFDGTPIPMTIMVSTADITSITVVGNVISPWNV